MNRPRLPILSVLIALVASLLTVPLVSARAAADGGLRWPAGQTLPTFATVRHLDVADIRKLPADQQLLLGTLQGVVNRSRPRVYLIQSDEDRRDWLPRDVRVTWHSDPMSLLRQYRSELRGLVVYDPAVSASVNVATTLAGLDDAAVASPAIAASARSAYGLKVVEDLRHKFRDDLAANTYAVAKLWPRTTHRVVAGLDPGHQHAVLRDYTVATRSLVIWLRPEVKAEHALLERVLRGMPVNAAYLGWWPSGYGGESDGTELASRHSVAVVATDWCTNLSVLSGLRAGQERQAVKSPNGPLRNRIYVTFTMTEGDNIQYNQHRMRQLWNDPRRGDTPINWTISPLLADAAPTLLSYYRHSASGNDYLVAGPSGAGYVYPTPWPAWTFRSFANRSAAYMRRAGLTVPMILNRVRGKDIDLPKDRADAYIDAIRPPGILLSWSDHTSTTRIDQGTPLSVSHLVSSVAEARSAIAKDSANWDGRAPLFLSIGVLAWNMTPSDVSAVADELGPEYEVVRGDQFFTLARGARDRGLLR